MISTISTKAMLLLIFLITLSQCVQIQSHNQVSYDPNFIQNIWKQIEATGYQNQLANTTFLIGIKSGQLQAFCFVRYMVQQIYYTEESINLWDKACKDGQRDVVFHKFCTQYRDLEIGIQDYYQKMTNIYSEAPIEVAKDYVQQMQKMYSQKPYYYIAIINYVCYKLYTSYFVKMLPDMDKHNPYAEFVKLNSNEIYLVDFENYINDNQDRFDRQQVKMILLKLLDYEIQFFRQSCPQTSGKMFKSQ